MGSRVPEEGAHYCRLMRRLFSGGVSRDYVTAELSIRDSHTDHTAEATRLLCGHDRNLDHRAAGTDDCPTDYGPYQLGTDY
jgi:hypothetical protein